MKKVIMAMVFAAATWSVSGQVVKMETTGSNPAYNVPEHIRIHFETSNPTVTTVTWAPVSEMWRASYRENNRVTQVYFNNTGEAYRVALPVISTHVPEEVVTAAMDLYGAILYDITKMRSAGNTDVYQVRLLENSVPRSIWMDEKGVEVKTDVYKIKVEDDEMKIKTEKL